MEVELYIINMRYTRTSNKLYKSTKSMKKRIQEFRINEKYIINLIDKHEY